jgi:hypothetical protein
LSLSGYRAHSLTLLELGGLWDLPILIMDALLPLGVELMLRTFCNTASTKILLARANWLLTLSFWGGLGGLKTVFEGLKMVLAQDAQGAPLYGPWPFLNSELGLSITPAHTAPPMLHFLDAVHKRDSQKADNVAVPVHLWLCAFPLG